jgi:hypothetical protein
MSSITTPTIQARRPDDLLAVPPILAELMADEPALVKHLQVAERYRAAGAKTVELARELEQARREDDERRKAALAAGKKPAPAKAPAVEDELRQTRRDVDLLAAALRESMGAFATRAVAFTDQAAAELERRREACEDRLRDLFRACEVAIAEHGELGGEAVWVAAVRLSGRVGHYEPGMKVNSLRRTSEAIRRLTLDLDEDLHRKGEIAEQREREAEVEARLKMPAGARVWAPGQPDKVVTEGGELVEDAEAER